MLKRLSQPYRTLRVNGTAGSRGINLADGLLLLAIIFWGLNFSLVKFALAEIPPLIFNGLRFAVAASLMVALTLAMGQRYRIQRRHWLHFIGLALVGNLAYQLLFILGADNTTANNSALILATVPAWVALFGTLLQTERVTGRGWLGVGLSLAGILLLIAGSDQEVEFRFGGATLLGDALILACTLCWSVYTMAIRPLSRHYPALVLTSLPTVLGTIPLALISIPSALVFDWGEVSLMAWSALVVSGIFSITLAYFFWNYGVSRLGSARTSFYSNLVPPVSLLVAWFALGEKLTPLQFLGALLALAGVVLARRYTYTVGRENST